MIETPSILKCAGIEKNMPHPTDTTALVAFGGVNYDKFPIIAGDSTPLTNQRLRDEREAFGILTKTASEAMATVQNYRALSVPYRQGLVWRGR